MNKIQNNAKRKIKVVMISRLDFELKNIDKY